MKSGVFIVVCGLFGLLFSCAVPHHMREEPIEEEVFVEETVMAEPVEGAGPPPVYIEGGTDGKNRKELYVNFHNSIKVHVDGGNTEHLVVSASSVGLTVGNAKKGLYTFYGRGAGTLVEIVAKDTVSGKSVAKVFDLVQTPAPSAYIWTYRKIFNNKLNFNAEEFKKQNAVILQHETRVPVMCLAESYTLLRIDANGKRSMHENKNRDGLFDKESQEIIATAQKGDVFIVQDIKSSCSPYPINNIVYTIK